MTTVLLTLGRMPKGLELARGLAAAGARVVVADPHGMHVSRYSRSVARSVQVTAPADAPDRFREELLSLVREEAVDLVVPISEESVHVARIAASLPEGVRFFGPGFDRARTLHDKLAFNRLSAGIGLPVPASAALGDAAARALAERTETVVKPVHGSAGIGLRFVPAGGILPATVVRPSLVQERLRGRLLSSLSVVHRGRVAGTAVYRATILSGSVAVAFERVDGLDAVSDWIARFAAALDYTGFLSFDLFLGGDGVARAIECNARLTSGIHFLEPEAVGRFLLRPEQAAAIPLKARRRFQHVFPALGVTEMSLFKGRFRRNLRAFLSSADVTWSTRDPLPFLMLNIAAYPILRQWMTGRMSLGEAAIADVEWREPEAAGTASSVRPDAPDT